MTAAIKTAFSGRIGQEPQLKTSKTAKPGLSLPAVVGSGGDAQWVHVAAFSDLAPELADRLRKGERVNVEGRVRLNTLPVAPLITPEIVSDLWPELIARGWHGTPADAAPALGIRSEPAMPASHGGRAHG